MAASDKSVAVSLTTDFLSDSIVSDGWHELTKSDYAKVIFSDLLCNAASCTVECKFQITDHVHEDPNDFVGLFRIGYEDLSQCLVSKMLSQTKCEDDGKLQRCVFTANELPYLDDGFYQFLYVTRDQEVCGASMPFQIKMSPLQLKESSVESGSSIECRSLENIVGGFLLVNNQVEIKVKENSSEQEKCSVQRCTLSDQKKEEIAAWVSQNPDYYSLIEQIREHTFTIDALQQSKDLAMKEVAQLYEILNKQNGELIQLRNMLAAYEEKIKMSQSLQEEKTTELNEMEKSSTVYEEKLKIYALAQEERDKQLSELEKEYCTLKNDSLALHEQQRAEINNLKAELEEWREMHKSQRDKEIVYLKHMVAVNEEKLKMSQSLQDEKDKLISQMEKKYRASLEESLTLQDQQQTEINNLKEELEKTREIEKAKWRPVTAKRGPVIDDVVLKAQNFAHTVSDAVKRLDFSDEYEVEKFFQLKIQMLIIMSKMSRAIEMANICDRNGLHKTIHDVMEKDAKRKSCVVSSSCTLKNRGPFLTKSNTNVPQLEKHVFLPPSTSAEIPSLADSSEKESTNEDVPNDVVKRVPPKKLFERELLEHQVIELPRLDVINKDTAMTLKTDQSLEEDDVTVINRLTEKIIKRGFNLYETIKLVDDSSSDSESDVSVNSECPASIRKDLICVGRVLEALSSLPNQTSLEQFVVVGNEDDKNLIGRKEWNTLLQKCALHYQVEILLEHIEKQKDGMKKLSEKICELLTKCMLLKDKVRDSKAVYEHLEATIDKKDMLIAKLNGDLDFKTELLCHFCGEKEELESRADLAERTVEDFYARIMEASELYRKQYREIGKLSKKLQKCKSAKEKTKSSKGESSMTSSGSSKTTSSFEVIPTDSVRNVNDSDTGEHLFEKASIEKNHSIKSSPFCGVASQPFVFSGEERSYYPDPFENADEEINLPGFEAIKEKLDSDKKLMRFAKTAAICEIGINPLDDLLPSIPELNSEHLIASASADKPSAETIESKSYQTTSVFSKFSTYQDFQEILKEHFAQIKKPAASKNSQECAISCYFCKQTLPLDQGNPSGLMSHFENKHSMKICPFCGQLFEDAIPPKYFQIHVEKHF